MNHVLIAHTSRQVCNSLRNALDKQTDMCVVGCAETTEELNFLLSLADVVLIDPELGRCNFSTLLHDIYVTYPETKVIVVGIQDEPQTILSYIEKGVVGYILSNESLAETVQKVRASVEGRALVSPSMVALMMERAAYLASQSTGDVFSPVQEAKVNALTPREREILTLIGDGYTNRAIADELVIVCGTVKNHVHNILKKLDSSNRYEAVALYQATNHDQNALGYAS